MSPSKAQLRRAFHPQVKQQAADMLRGPSAQYVTTSVGGFDFVSPAHERFRTAVELDILLLTRSGSGSLGDTDNRLKTLVDGLTRPANEQQLQAFSEPEEGGPTFCLLDDDGLLSRVTLDSREWFVPDTAEGDVLAIVTAKIVLGPECRYVGADGNDVRGALTPNPGRCEHAPMHRSARAEPSTRAG